VFLFLVYVRSKYPAMVERLVKASMAEKLQEFYRGCAGQSKKDDLEPAERDKLDGNNDSD